MANVETENHKLQGRIKKAECIPSPSHSLVEYCPGNMTKYIVLFQTVGAELAIPMGCISSATIVVFVNMRHSPSILIPDTMGYLSLSYFMEKTGLKEGDAAPLVKLLRHELNLQGN